MNDVYENIIKKSKDLCIDRYSIDRLLKDVIKEEPKKFLEIECLNEVIYIAYMLDDDNTYITAYDKRSWCDNLRAKTIKVLPNLPDSMSLKEVFFSTLELGGVEDKLFAIINNPNDRTIDRDSHNPSLEDILNLSKTVALPDDILKDAVSQIKYYRGITIIKSFPRYANILGRVYFIKRNTIKSFDLIGDRSINLEHLEYRIDLINELFKDVPEYPYIQCLETVLHDLKKTKIKIYRDTGLKLRFTDSSGCDTCYFIGNDYITTYDQERGITETKIYPPDDIRNSSCDRAHVLLEAVDIENVKEGEYFTLEIDESGFEYKIP